MFSSTWLLVFMKLADLVLLLVCRLRWQSVAEVREVKMLLQ